MLAFSYSEKNIYLDASHALLDGISMLEVLKTTLLHYCSMKYVKECHGTPGIIINTFFSEAVMRLCQVKNLPMVTTMYVNSRTMLDKNKAGGCLVTSVELPLTGEMKKLDFGKRTLEYRKMQKEKTSKEQILKKVSRQVRGYINIEMIAGLQEKLNKLGKSDSVFHVGTFAVSSTGRDPFNSVSKYISEVHNIVVPTAYLIEMNCVNNMFTIDFLQSFETTRYVDEFEKILKEEGISYIRGKAEPYKTASVFYDKLQEALD